MKERFNKDYLANWAYEGKNYMFPFYITKTLLFWNKSMFKEAGLSGPPETFDQVMEYAAKMAGGEKTGFITLNFDWLYWPLFAANKIELLTPDMKRAAFNTPQAQELVAQARQGDRERRHQQGLLDGPLGREQRGLRGRERRHAPRPFAGLFLHSRPGQVGQSGHPRRGPFPRRLVDPELARPGDLEGLEESGARLRIPEDDHQRPVDQALRDRAQGAHRQHQDRRRRAAGDEGVRSARRAGAAHPARDDGPPGGQLAHRRWIPRSRRPSTPSCRAHFSGGPRPRRRWPRRSGRSIACCAAPDPGPPGSRAVVEAAPQMSPAPVAIRQPRARLLLRTRRSRRAVLVWCFLAPSLAIFLLYRIIPLIWNGVLSFQEWSPYRPSKWAGLMHYEEMLFYDDVFWEALWNTLHLHDERADRHRPGALHRGSGQRGHPRAATSIAPSSSCPTR